MTSTPGEATTIRAFELSAEQVHKSPHGLAYDLLLKPRSASKVVPTPSPSSRKDINEKMRSAEERKKKIDFVTTQKQKEKGEKIKKAKRQILELMENQQKQILDKVEKKTMTAEETLSAQKKEQEEKREARELRAQEAKKIHEELIEIRKKQAKTRLAQLQVVEENRDANQKAIVEKAKADYEKSEYIRAEQQKKIEELDERSKQSLTKKEVKRDAHLTGIKDKCAKHVEYAKQRGAIAEERKANRQE